MGEDNRRARLEELFAAHARTVLAYARRRTNAASAEDVLSEVFIVAWRRLDDLPADPEAWLLACARNALLNHERGEQRRSKLVERLSAHTSRAEFAVELNDGVLAQALATLSERDRELLLLLVWEELPAERAAVVLGCSRQTLRVRTHRARARLARALADIAADDGATPMKLEACND
jgi:RNA polymerase sigma factor (sigma-70 family)